MIIEIPKAGWYLVRASTVGDVLKIKLVGQNSERVRVFDAHRLPGRRLRTYLWCEQGSILTETPATSLEAEIISAHAVHFRVLYRIWRYSGKPVFAKMKWSCASISSKQRRLEAIIKTVRPIKRIFADIESLSSKINRQVSIHRIDIDNLKTAKERISDLPKVDWIIWGNSDLKLHENAPACLSLAVKHNPDTRTFYSQHLDSSLKCFVKPEFNLAAYLHCDFLLPALFMRVDAAREFVSSIQILDRDSLRNWYLARELKNSQPVRIDEFLVQSDYAYTQCELQIHDDKTVSLVEHVYGKFEPDFDSPFISIIIPTYNGYEYLKPCIDSVFNNTNYKNFEVIIVNNNSDDEVALSYLEKIQNKEPNISVLDYPHPFNYSAINNFAVSHARGSVICFLNNDIEVITPNWLDDMLFWVRHDKIGAVGAKLIYKNGKIQHAGVVVGMGGAAGHAHRFDEANSSEVFTRSVLGAEVTAEATVVTAACMLVKKKHFEKAGGFDEHKFAIAYNDVDFCLKLQQSGLTNIYCSQALLYHYESVSRGDDLAPDKKQRYMRELKNLQRKWHTKRFKDNQFSKHLDRSLESQPLIKSPKGL